MSVYISCTTVSEASEVVLNLLIAVTASSAESALRVVNGLAAD